MNISTLLSANKKYIIIFLLVFHAIFFYQGLILSDKLNNDISIVQVDSDTVNPLNNIIIIVQSENQQNILSESVYNWTAHLVFKLQSIAILRDLSTRPQQIDHVFSKAYDYLAKYLRASQIALIGANLTYFITQTATSHLLESYTAMRTEGYNHSTALNQSITTQLPILNTSFASLPLHALFSNEYSTWLNMTIDFLATEPEYTSLVNLKTLLRQYIVLNNILTAFQSSILYDLFEPTINHFQFTPNNDSFYAFAAETLVGTANSTDVEFLKNLYANGNPLRPVQIAQQNLMEFLNREFLPPGLDQQMLDALLVPYTNYNVQKRGQTTSSFIIRTKLLPKISTAAAEELLQELNTVFTEYNVNSLQLSIFMVNYKLAQVENDNAYTKNFTTIDYISILAILALVYINTRHFRLSILLVLPAWITSISVRGVLIFALAPTGLITQGGIAIASALVFGAGVNYTVFFFSRFLEESKADERLQKTIRYAGHSILISGIAVALTLVPLAFSTFRVIKGFALAGFIGIILQLPLLLLTLPIVLEYIASVFHDLPKMRNFSIHGGKITSQNASKLVKITLLIVVIAGIISFHDPSNINADQFISSNSSTGKAIEIISTGYPPDFFSKVIVKLSLADTVYTPTLNISSLQPLQIVSSALQQLDHVVQVYSAVQPYGSIINTSAIGILQQELLQQFAEEYITNDTTYLVISYDIPSDSLDIYPQVDTLIGTLKRLIAQNNFLSSYSLSGTPIESYTNYQEFIRYTPLQTIFAFLLLTAFLTFQYRNISIPLRLQLTILIAAILGLALSTIIYYIFFKSALNLFVLVTTISILLALGTDFDIFVYSRIEEEYVKHKNLEDAIHSAVQASSSGIVLAGLVMAIAFSSLLFSNYEFLMQFGLVISLSILIDVYFIRTYLVPAILITFKSSTIHILDKKLI